MNGILDIDLEFVDPEIDAGTQTASVAFPASPGHGSLVQTRGTVTYTYTADTDYSGEDFFTFTVADGEAVSEPVRVDLYVHNGWVMNFVLDGADRMTLQIGENASLTPGWNLGHDLAAPPAAGNSFTAKLLEPVAAYPFNELERDIRNAIAGQRWQANILTSAESGPVTLSWDPADTPLGGLLLYRLTEEDGDPAEAPLDMATTTSIEIPASEERWYGISAPVEFEVEASPIAVPEGSSALARVRLTAQPVGEITAQVSHESGDLDLAANAATLTFTPTNWNQWQTVELTAAEDADADDGAAQFTVVQTSGSIPVAETSLQAEEIDNEVILTIAKSGHGTVADEGNTIIDLATDLPVTISATALAGAAFSHWIATAGVAIEAPDWAETRVTAMSGDGTVTAVFVDLEPVAIALSTPALDSSVVVDEGDSAIFSVTVTGGLPPYSYAWKLDGAAAPNADDSASFGYQPDVGVVAHPNKIESVVVSCTVTDSQGTRASVSVSWESVTVNDKDQTATAPGIALSTETPTTGDDISAPIIHDSTDPDGDAIEGYAYHWSTPGKTVASATLPAGQTVKGEVWTLLVSALTEPYGDGSVEGVPAERQVTIGNTAPVIVPPNPIYCRRGESTQIQLSAGDPDVDDGVDVFDWQVDTPPLQGQAAIDDQTAVLTYDANDDGAGEDTFTISVSDGTDSATVDVTVTVVDWWLEVMLSQGRSDQSVVIGVMDGATEGIDPIDKTADMQARIIALSADADALSIDFLGGLDGRPWLLVVEGEAGNRLEWDRSAVPPAGLVLRETDITGRPVKDNTVIDMAAVSQHDLTETGPRHFIVSPIHSFQLPVHVGWNLVCSPVAPVQPDIATLFDGATRATGHSLRDGRGALASGTFWVWSASTQGYQATDDLEALVGMWIYVEDTDGTITLDGTPLLVSEAVLQPGWNLIGPRANMALPGTAQWIGPVWWWDGTRYQTAAGLIPGFGHWFLVADETTIDLE